MSVGSKVILLLLAVGLQSLFHGESVGYAYARPNSQLSVEEGAVSPDYYKSLYDQLGLVLGTNNHGAKAIMDQNVAQESHSSGFMNMGSKIDHSDDVHTANDSDGEGPGAFTLGTHNTYQSSNSNMTTNMGSWVTQGRNIYNR